MLEPSSGVLEESGGKGPRGQEAHLTCRKLSLPISNLLLSNRITNSREDIPSQRLRQQSPAPIAVHLTIPVQTSVTGAEIAFDKQCVQSDFTLIRTDAAYRLEPFRLVY